MAEETSDRETKRILGDLAASSEQLAKRAESRIADHRYHFSPVPAFGDVRDCKPKARDGRTITSS